MQYQGLYKRFFQLTDKRGFQAVACPLHEDKDKSAAVDLATGVFTCHACQITLSPAKFLAKLKSISLAEAVSELEAGQTEVVEVKLVNQSNDTALLEALWARAHEVSYEWGDDYANSRDIDLSLVEHGYLPADLTHWKRDSLVLPYRQNGRIVALAYRSYDGLKSFEPGSCQCLWGVDDLGEQPAIIVEGMSDRLALLGKLNGFTIVSTPGIGFRREWKREFADCAQVILLPQVDEAGSRLVTSCESVFGNRLIVNEPIFRRGQLGNDWCDWLRYNPISELQKTLDALTRVGKRKALSGAELLNLEDTAETSILIEGLLERQQICIVGGPPKSMKTWLLLNLMRCLLTPGSSFVGIDQLVSRQPDLKILVVEEEGSQRKLRERAEAVLEGTPWLSQTYWAHRTGWKLDDGEGLLEDEIRRLDVDILCLDPFRRLHEQDENSATEMAKVWRSLHRLTTLFPKLSIILLHHTTKASNLADAWNSLRGSSTAGAEPDLGIFVEKRRRSEGHGLRMVFDGRDIEPIEDADGKAIFKLGFDKETMLLSYSTGKVHVDKHVALLAELKDRGGRWPKEEAAKFFGVSLTTIDNWVKKLELVEVIPPARGRPSTLVYSSDKE